MIKTFAKGKVEVMPSISGFLGSDVDNNWTDRQITLLRSWADKARCYSWMHTKSSNYYKKLNYMFTIPSILLSTIAGSANFMVSGTEQGGNSETTLFLGSMNLFTAMLMSTNQFLKLPEHTDRHKNAANGYSKFRRNIKTQLSLEAEDRENGIQFVSICQREFDTLIEQSPDIPEKIIDEFKKEFAESTLVKPDIVNGMMDSPTDTVSISI